MNETPAGDANSANTSLPTGARRLPGRGKQSGFSLMARGEPQIWFTGGMLALCLIMIVGILGLIFYNGLATFWPGKVGWLLLTDGSMDVGELHRREAAAGAGPTSTTGAGDEPRTNAVSNAGWRANYRTGNFDVTGRHFRWFGPEELRDSGIVYPEWLAIVERTEWGRLYGLPSRFTELLAPSEAVAQSRAEIQTAIELLESAPREPIAVSSHALELLQRRSAELLAGSLREQSRHRAESEKIQWKTAGQERWQPADAKDDSSDLVEARVFVDSPPAIYERLSRLAPELTRRRRAIDRLQHEIAKLDQRIASKRVAIRAAELRSSANVSPLIDGLEGLIERQVQLAESMASAGRVTLRLGLWIQEADVATELVNILENQAVPNLREQAGALDEQFSQWRLSLADKPAAVRAAVDEYARTWREVAAGKLEMQREIARLEVGLSRAEIAFTAPTPATSLAALSPEGMARLRDRQWPGELLEQLRAQSLEPVPDSLELGALNGQSKLVTFNDPQRGRQYVWLTSSDSGAAANVSLCGEILAPCHKIVRAFPANRLSFSGRVGVYLDRWREFLLEDPREANSEGGVFPAIWGTVVMTLIMTIAVVPFGVMAALYLREYARSGWVVSILRICINNLAGVPSIVYGVFGFAFFCYTIGAWIDGGPRNADIQPMPRPIWSLLLGALAVVGTAAFLFGIFSSGASHGRTRRNAWLGSLSSMGWLFCAAAFVILLLKSPYFPGFYAASLPNPTFGKGGLLWASLTLALLTLPVVIVATEEALSAVPNSLREGSLACGASKWQTIRHIVLPHARPGIMTGAILAMARGAGEVAPLMMVGALPTAPELPMDGEFPYFHGSRSFMHLGYQIYFLGFQSQNSDASKPMVFTCALLLILIIAALNISAILLRSRLRRRYLGNQF